MSSTSILKSFISKKYEDDEYMEDLSKPLPKKKKEEGESEFEHKISQWTEEVKDRPKRFPGGKDQAVAIAAEEAGVAKKANKASLTADDDFTADLKKYVEKDDYDEDTMDNDYAKHLDMGDDEYLDIEDAKKALSTSSLHIPRPPGGYDRFDIMRSATTPNTRAHSGLLGPEGVAPLVGETLRTVEDSANVRARTAQNTYKSCNFHGLVHRVSTGCVMCTTTMSKSSSCKSCGDEMYKVAGGALSCKACG